MPVNIGKGHAGGLYIYSRTGYTVAAQRVFAELWVSTTHIASMVPEMGVCPTARVLAEGCVGPWT